MKTELEAGTPKEMKTHRLKTWPEYFEKILSGEKNFEVRKNDRNFNTGDILILEEWNLEYFDGNRPVGKYTGRSVEKVCGYILSDPNCKFGLMTDTVVISLLPLLK